MKKIKRHIETIFCDDIRHEMGGKLSFIGTYFETMFVQEFPVILPKFCISVKVVSYSLDLMPSITVKVLMDEEVLDESQFPAEEPVDVSKDDNSPPNINIAKIGRLQFAYTPLEIKKECNIKVSILFDGIDEPVNGLALRILKAPTT